MAPVDQIDPHNEIHTPPGGPIASVLGLDVTRPGAAKPVGKAHMKVEVCKTCGIFDLTDLSRLERTQEQERELERGIRSQLQH